MKNTLPRSERILMMLIIIFFALPLPLTFLAHLGPLKKSLRMGHLKGVLPRTDYTPFSWPALFNAQYQASVAGFFDNEFFGRPGLIQLTDEFYYRLFKISPMKSTLVMVGKKGTLFEGLYWDEYVTARRRKEELEPLVRNIRQMQDLCHARGIGFALVITPSKASIYPGLLPAGWERSYDPRPRAYEEFLPLLREQGIHFVDGHTIAVAARDSSSVPIFPKGGIHWGAFTAFLTTNALIAELQSQGQPLQAMHYNDYQVLNNPSEQDADILQLMNLMFPWHYPVVEFTIKPIPVTGHRPNIVFVGGSFIWRMTDLLNESRQFSEIDCFYYYKVRKKSFFDGKSRIISEPVLSVDFDREIFAADNLVLEINESFIPNIPNHLINFTTDALHHAAASPNPTAPYLYENPQPGK